MSRPKLTSGARALLERALDNIKRRPDSVDMDLWIAHYDGVKGREPWCGTTACFAGHVTLAAGFPRRDYYFPDDTDIPRRHRKLITNRNQNRDPGDVCAALLGLSAEDQRRLYTVEHWPSEYADRYRLGKTARSRATATVARIRYWMRTGE